MIVGDDELLALCRDLVAAPSINPPGRTVEAADVVQRFLSRHGITAERLARDPEKPNLVVTIDGNGPGPHLILNGHLDTVQPGDAAAWSVPLHEMTEQGDRLYGLGMGNMKAGVTALAAAFVDLTSRRDAWSGRVSLTAVADETVFGPDGAAFLLETRPDLRGDALLCGEGPGAMDLAVAEKGLLWLEIEARAVGGQGMLAQRSSSAIARLSGALTAIDALNDRFVTPPSELPGLVGLDHGLRLSVNCGIIRGGRFISQAADRAVAEIDVRVPPGLTVDEVERDIAAIATGTPGISLRRIKGWDPNWTMPGEPIVRAVAAAAQAVRGRPPRPVVRLPASDASRWRAAGVPAVCIGPQPTLASGIDDHALRQDVLDCARTYRDGSIRYFTIARSARK